MINVIARSAAIPRPSLRAQRSNLKDGLGTGCAILKNEIASPLTFSMSRARNDGLRIFDLGLCDYQRSYQLQKEILEKKKSGALSEDALILSEPYPVFTAGRAARNISGMAEGVLGVDRGGEITYHGPGQLLIYPVFDLRALGYDLRGYLNMLGEVITDTLAHFGIFAHSRECPRGVWAGDKKIASIGIGVSRWIAFHGAALNVNTDLKHFSRIKPCGLDAGVMTSMQEQLGENVDMQTVKKEITNEFEQVPSGIARVSRRRQ